MLTDYFSCYISIPFHKDKNSQKIEDCQIVTVIEVLSIQILMFTKFK